MDNIPNPERVSQFFMAVNSNNLDALRDAIDGGVNVNTLDEQNQTALHIASLWGHTAVARLLLGRGANVHVLNEDNQTPLHIASFLGDTAFAGLLLEHRANVNAVESGGKTPLHLASLGGHTAVARLLLENGANVNPLAFLNRTPLHDASSWGHTAVARLLLENGANVNPLDVFQLTPLHIASFLGDTAFAGLLLEHRANVNPLHAQGNTSLALCTNIGTAKLLINHGSETIGVTNRNPQINVLIQENATKLTNNLTVLTQLPDDISQLTVQQKILITHLTAPKKAGDPLKRRVALGNKNLIDYMREDKPQLLMFAEGYHKDKIFSGVQQLHTDFQKRIILFEALRTHTVIDNGTFLREHPIKQLGIDFKHMNQATTKIQALGRGGIVRQNNMRTTGIITI